MPLYFYCILFIGLSFITLFIRSLVSSKKNISVELFNEGLRNENNGQYEKAVANYESALNEVNKTRFHKTFKNKIIDKLKVLHTLIDYNNGVRMIRQ
jgi:outer membrane protein assembly factor BamD (BamD/ComL family)